MVTEERVYTGGSIGDLIVQALARHPDRIAIIDDQKQLTYRQLARRIGQAMSAFTALGLKRGDGVVQLAGNRGDVFVVMAAVYLLGLRSISLHGMGGLDDHAYIVQDSDASFFVADKGYTQRLDELRPRCPAIRHWYSHEAGIPGQTCFWEFAEQFEPMALRVSARPDDVIRLAYTGGTTGKPKGVMLTNRSMWMQALTLMGARPLPGELRLLCPTPISHGAGAMLVPTLWRGGTIILQRGFDPERYLAALELHKATATFLVPTMIYSILDHPGAKTADFSSLEMVSYGASPMSPTRLQEALRVFGPVLVQSYGQTECPSNILFLSQEDHVRRDVDTLGSAGMPYPGVTVALLDENDMPVEQGAVGELCVRSPLVMEGYWKLPELTAQVMRNGWLHTGDMAYRDEHGYYFLVDRKKDMIISGGFNVYPKEIENVLGAHEAVAAAAVFGVPDGKWGEAVKAVVALRPGMSVGEDELKAAVRSAKGPVNTPKSIDFVDALPLTALGKPDKNRLRKQYWSGQDRRIN